MEEEAQKHKQLSIYFQSASSFARGEIIKNFTFSEGKCLTKTLFIHILQTNESDEDVIKTKIMEGT
ncbi:MAG: hypothetical protein DRP91_10165 [Candidatus Neomarinimicrobiota bacterium]|nr:MAG: hypothetical protein DRP91_10165 [Candidatus Neomarinimicrobiota bacterium]